MFVHKWNRLESFQWSTLELGILPRRGYDETKTGFFFCLETWCGLIRVCESSHHHSHDRVTVLLGRSRELRFEITVNALYCTVLRRYIAGNYLFDWWTNLCAWFLRKLLKLWEDSSSPAEGWGDVKGESKIFESARRYDWLVVMREALSRCRGANMVNQVDGPRSKE